MSLTPGRCVQYYRLVNQQYAQHANPGFQAKIDRQTQAQPVQVIAGELGREQHKIVHYPLTLLNQA